PVKDWLELNTAQKVKTKETPSGAKTAAGGKPKDYAVQKELIEKDKANAYRQLESKHEWNPQSKMYEDPIGIEKPL
ncbi:MAG: hypothetical protein ACRD3S_12620, partial [Terracidiphilus sp.]